MKIVGKGLGRLLNGGGSSAAFQSIQCRGMPPQTEILGDE